MNFGSLFAGIGGMDLGLERAGMVCKWQVEIDDYATRVLTKHWPDVTRFRDVRGCGKRNLQAVDVIVGGFPCQDISNAGKRAGIDGERSGLWSEYFRIVCELRPRFVLVENVAALLERGIERVLGDLASCGYDAEWEVLPACVFGAPYTRERVFIIAYPESMYWQVSPLLSEGILSRQFRGVGDSISRTFWEIHQPPMVGVDSRFTARVDRTRVLGNAVVPQVAEWIGKRIMDSQRY